MSSPVLLLDFPPLSKITSIMYEPDMTPFKDAITICGWVKKERSTGYGVWFMYRGNDGGSAFVISDDGSWGSFFTLHSDRAQIFEVQFEVWYHQCVTWSNVSRKLRMYFNGQLMGTKDELLSRFPSGGLLVLGELSA